MTYSPVLAYRAAAKNKNYGAALAAIKKFPPPPKPVRAGVLGDSEDGLEYIDMLRIDFRDGDWTQSQYEALKKALPKAAQ